MPYKGFYCLRVGGILPSDVASRGSPETLPTIMKGIAGGEWWTGDGQDNLLEGGGVVLGYQTVCRPPYNGQGRLIVWDRPWTIQRYRPIRALISGLSELGDLLGLQYLQKAVFLEAVVQEAVFLERIYFSDYQPFIWLYSIDEVTSLIGLASWDPQSTYHF